MNNNMGSNNNFTAGNDINQKFNKSNQNNINKFEINNLIPVRKTKEDIEREMKETMRPCLRDNVGKLVTCFGYVVSKYDNLGDGVYTVINVIDREGNYLADHIQLDFKPSLYHYDYSIGDYIRFTGYITEYNRNNGTKDFNINITEKIYMIPSRLHYDGEIISDDNIKYDKIRDYLSNSNITKINNLIEKLRQEINDLTKYYYIDDFIYYYVLNQFMLNTATYKIYEGELRDYNVHDTIKILLLFILGSVIYELKSNRTNYLYDILHSICQYCNLLQGVETYENVNKNPKFIEFCTSFMNCTGKKKLGKLFNFVRHRQNDFNEDKTFGYDVNKDNILTRTYAVLNDYIN